MSEGKTAPVVRPSSRAGPNHPPCLIRFYPLGQPQRFGCYALGPGSTTVGRDHDCSIVIDDVGVSRRHAVVEFGAGKVTIADAASANGVIVGTKRLTESVLTGGEVVRLGDTFFRFCASGPMPQTGEIELHTTGIVSGYSLDGVRALLTQAAQNELTVMILGETGTGKDLAAEYLHCAGRRHDGPFVAVNCAALPPTIVESELFGHAKGAFTGATVDAIGLMRQAHGGTLFLDEIGEIPLPVQSKLLRVLQDRQVRPVGASRASPIDVRVVCATNRDVGALVRAGEFRADLYARMAEIVVQMPSLRQRIEDLPLLAQHFLEKHGAQQMRVSAPAIELLCSRLWPLNVRGLETAVRRGLMLGADATVLDAEQFPEDPLGEWVPKPHSRRTFDVPASVRSSKQTHPAEPDVDPRVLRLIEVLRKHQGDVDEVAKELKLSRSQVYRRAKNGGIDPSRFRP